MGVVIFMAKRFQKNNQSRRPRPDKTLIVMICVAITRAWAAKHFISTWWFCLHLQFSWSPINLRGGTVDLWWASIIFLTLTHFISRITDLLTLSFISELGFFRLLSYSTLLWVCKIKPDFCLINRIWTLFEMSDILIASSKNTKTYVKLSWLFLMSRRLMIWHWLAHREWNKRMPQSTDSISPSQLTSNLLIELPRGGRIASQTFFVISREVDQIAFNGFSPSMLNLSLPG